MRWGGRTTAEEGGTTRLLEVESASLEGGGTEGAGQRRRHDGVAQVDSREREGRQLTHRQAHSCNQ